MDAHPALGGLLGQAVPLELLAADSRTQRRPFHGHVTACELMGGNGGLARYRLVVEPWLAFLRQRIEKARAQPSHSASFFFTSTLFGVTYAGIPSRP